MQYTNRHKRHNCLALPYLQYCNIILANVGTTKLEPLHKLQKIILRICTNSSFRSHSRPFVFRLKTLNIYDIHRFQIALVMFRTIHNITPCNVSQMFTITRSVHYHNTRSSNKCHYPKVNTRFLFNSLRHRGNKEFNKYNFI